MENLLDEAGGFRRAYEDTLTDHALDSYWYEGRLVDPRSQQLDELFDSLDQAARDAAPSISAVAPPSMERPAPRVILWEEQVGIAPAAVHPSTPQGWRSVGRYCGR